MTLAKTLYLIFVRTYIIKENITLIYYEDTMCILYAALISPKKLTVSIW